MLSKISVRGDGSPRDMVFHASKPSTGMGFCGSNVPPNYKTKQNDNNDFSTKQANNTGGPSKCLCSIIQERSDPQLVAKTKIRPYESRTCVSPVCLARVLALFWKETGSKSSPKKSPLAPLLYKS